MLATYSCLYLDSRAHCVRGFASYSFDVMLAVDDPDISLPLADTLELHDQALSKA